MDVARTGNFPCARFSFFCIIFRIVFFLYLVNLVITLLGCHLSVPLSSSRQPVGEGSLETLTDYMYDVPYIPTGPTGCMSCLDERGSGFVTCL